MGINLFSQELILGEKQKLFSSILGEEREILIHLPKNYQNNDSTKYPVVYVLDAKNNFAYLSTQVDYLSRIPYAELPEMIVVSIINTDRTLNFTPTKSFVESPDEKNQKLFENSGGAESFLNFIQQELKPFLKSKYRTNDFSILSGHSFGGLFTIFCYLNHPEYFNAYIANDPSLWWDNQVLVNQLNNITRGKNQTPFLYIAKATNKDENKFGDKDNPNPILTFKNILQKKDSNHFAYKLYPNDDHGTVAFQGNYDGLRWLFNGYKSDIKNLIFKPEELENHYKKFSKKMNYDFIPEKLYLEKLYEYSNKRGKKESANYFKNLKESLYKN